MWRYQPSVAIEMLHSSNSMGPNVGGRGVQGTIIIQRIKLKKNINHTFQNFTTNCNNIRVNLTQEPKKCFKQHWKITDAVFQLT